MNPADFGSPPASACTQGSGSADRITRTTYDAAGQRLQLREGVGAHRTRLGRRSLFRPPLGRRYDVMLGASTASVLVSE